MARRPGRETYRHGAVRAEAIAAAYAQVAADGHEAVSLRRVADAIGVAHRSLYNHFEDREALLDAVAERGFFALAGLLAAAEDRNDFVRLYLTFALDNPRLDALMASRRRDAMRRNPSLLRAAQLCVDSGRQVFRSPQAAPAEVRQAVIRALMLLRGALELHSAGLLEVADDEGLIAQLQTMVAAG